MTARQKKNSIHVSSMIDARTGLQKRDFSYGVFFSSFSKCLNRLGIEFEHLPRPEIYPETKHTDSSLKIHLIIRKFPAIRVVAGAYNIAVIAWEFEKLQSEYSYEEGPFYDQLGTLMRVEEVWATSTHMTKVLRSNGIEQVHFLPSPVAAPFWLGPLTEAAFIQRRSSRYFGRLAFLPTFSLTAISGLDGEGTKNEEFELPLLKRIKNPDVAIIYISVFNPEDPRKNVETLIQVFASFSYNNSNSYLILKCNTELKSAALRLLLVSRIASTVSMNCDNIIFLCDDLSVNQLADLYRLCDFYLCLSHGEGQNLPLQESMACGCIPVSVENTAMSDCVTANSGFVIKSTLSNIGKKVCFHNIPGLEWYTCSVADVYKQLEKSSLATTEQLYLKYMNCVDIISNVYSEDAVASRISTMFERITR